ncbi:ATP-binding protein [Yersinia enterocolitica]|uniref:ATP-binding protein n=1 Tax=Yersinia TaxID=629 RepID=UPI0005DD4B1A|nr:ATP-binding protein [Yersinia intermedia]EKN6195699.1 DNA replication protein DnaC [Yersinia enterocolitica]CNI87829.1 putative NTP-binding protein [Yersinia intermedia]HDL6648412.1 ATP-binding protein [Yersinia enterocolitica]
MNNGSSVIKRLQAVMPEGVQPKFTTAAELMAWHQEQAIISSQETVEANRVSRLQKVLGRSGIQALHQSCTFQNYNAELPAQRSALEKAKEYASKFGSGFGGFVFSGGCGTGKNHLAAAIGNDLISRNKSVLVVTIPDLMMRFRETYQDGSKQTEAGLMKELCSVDLLVLDDIGVQRDNKNEGVVLFQIVDRRLSDKKPVGMLTNLDYAGLVSVLSIRIMDRMTMDGGLWVNFDWPSYRQRVVA